MVQIRIGAQEAVIPEAHWEAWVSEGRIPPEALVFSPRLTGGLWRRADTIELYRFFRDTGADERAEASLAPHLPTPFAGILDVAFPRRSLSGAELLLSLNLLVAVVLAVAWGAEYGARLGIPVLPHAAPRGLAWDFYHLFVRDRIPVGFVATLFIHAGLRHLFLNMVSLIPSAAFVEYLYGWRVYLVYLLGGLAGALASFLFKDHGPMSVGASGAIYALIGTVTGFVLRHYRNLPRWHRWRARRIYAPILTLATLPSILHADWRAHVGGFLGGLLLGLILPLAARGRAMLLPTQSRS